jgi:hypothetical protein
LKRRRILKRLTSTLPLKIGSVLNSEANQLTVINHLNNFDKKSQLRLVEDFFLADIQTLNEKNERMLPDPRSGSCETKVSNPDNSSSSFNFPSLKTVEIFSPGKQRSEHHGNYQLGTLFRTC